MIEVLTYFLVFLAAIGLGLFYFGGLWWTVQRIPKTRHPALLTLGSFLCRLGLVVFGFYLVTGGHWARLLVCILGFLLTRAILVRRWGPPKEDARARPQTGEDSAYHT